MYWCRTLGELALYPDPGHPDPLLRAGKSLAILAYLGLTPARSADRDLIARLFWPEAEAASAHHALRQALYRLRQAASDPPPVEQRNGLLVCAEDVRFDCLEGERALVRGDLEPAYAHLRGSFLPGYSCDSSEIAQWVDSQGARFAECWLRAGEALIERAFAEGRPGRAVAVAEELRHASPLDDDRALLLLSTLDRAGQTRRALAEYQAHRVLLAGAVEDDPAPELVELADELERSLRPLEPNGGVSLPFVGRARTWSILLDGLRDAEGGRCSMVLIEGDAGLGKTRLIEEFAARARARGASWLTGKCYEIEQALPLAVISHVLRGAAERGEDGDQDLSRLMRGARRREGSAVGDVEPGLGLRTGIVSWLEELAADGLVLLTCDDIHWADPASLRLLHYVRNELASTRIMVVCSYRPAELSPVARRFAGSLATESLARIETLEPLSTNDLNEMLSALGSFESPELARALAADLHRHTGGNPLFVSELVEALEAEGLLRVEAGRWIGTPRLRRANLPKTLRKALTDRVDALDSELRFALDVMAALDEAADGELLAAVLGVSPPKADVILVRLTRARMLRRLTSDAYQVIHDELRQLVYAAIPDHRRRELHARIAAALEGRGEAARPGGAARLARHLEQAGDASRAHRYALAAADEAAAFGATEARSSFIQLAQALAPHPAEDVPAARAGEPQRIGWHRSWSLAGIAAAVGVTMLAVVGLDRGGSAPGTGGAPWEQGTLYLEALHTGSDGQDERTWHRLAWPESAGAPVELAEVRRWPRELPPPLVTKVVPTKDLQPTKIFRDDGQRVVQVTEGTSDDISPIWSPDRRWIALSRGWRVGDDYVFSVFVIDSAGAPVRRITDGNYQDFILDWSPDGSRLAFNRHEGGNRQLWIADVDGGGALDLSGALDLPEDREWTAAFSPDGRTLAAVAAGGRAIRLIELDRMLVRHLGTTCASLSVAPLWSPGGDWLGIICPTSSGKYLAVVAADGSSGPHVLLELSSRRWGRIEWVGGEPTHVATLEIRPETPNLSTGGSLPLSTRAATADGAALHPSIRWKTADSAVAVIDSLGNLRARRPGSTWVIASAGGFRAESTLVSVEAAKIDTLLDESWSEGIDTARWTLVGSPRPEIVTGVGPVGEAALLSNGDDRWPSGVLSKVEYDLTAGLTIEFPIRVRYTGEHWQEVEAALTPLEGALVNGERSAASLIFNLWMSGPSPTYPKPVIHCNGLSARLEWSVEAAEADWHQIALQVRPDGIGECYLDGQHLGSSRFRGWDGRTRNEAALFLGGRSYQTRIYHGPVVVTRGLRY